MPTVAELEQQLKEAKKEEYQKEQEKRKEFDKVWKARAKWGFKVVVGEILTNKWFDLEHLEGLETVCLTRYLMNEDEISKIASEYQLGIRDDELRSQQSLSYFRVNDVICHQHGGLHVLQEFSICSDEEWEQIKQGNPPDRLLRSTYRKK